MKDLHTRVEKLEKENSFLRRHCKRQSKKIDIITLLKTRPAAPSTLFLPWFKECILAKVHAHLETVFQLNLTTAIQSLLKQTAAAAMENPLSIPLYVHPQRSGEMYAYIESQQWIQLTPDQIDGQIRRIMRQFLADFDQFWVQANRAKIETEESFRDQYVHYYKKVLGEERVSEEVMNKKLRYFWLQEWRNVQPPVLMPKN